ncbi:MULTISPECIES: PilW family protein [unclassified Microbulbifer]|uniref:PilW family protein n=1 Tax=unclassified Microbulbifer TaxID=2619833 RepID=UPI001E59DAC8|nr:PilW family protein [Microbulbifer sp. YPW16]UHQ54549.1 PilW family protein [Microbulbifer sp. YPW16]
MRRQQGISLVELMVALAIGVVLMTGVVQLFLSSRVTFTTQQALSRVQETGRLGMEFLAQDIRMAGYMGCMSRNMSFTNTLNNSNDLAYRFNVGIEGVDNYSSAMTGYPAALAGTDMLVVRSANGLGVGVEQNNDSSQLFAEDTGTDPNGCGTGQASLSGLCIGDILVVADCQKARVFQATNLQDTGGVSINVVHSGNSSGGTYTPGNALSSWGGASGDPSESFGPDSEIIKVNTTVYYLANQGAGGEPALFRKIGNQTPQALLEGVQDMQLTYGRDTDGDDVPDTYVDGSVLEAASAWGEALSVRVELLVRSTDDNVVPDPQPYTYAGSDVTPTDRRLRQVFVNTIGIRSRLP